MNYSNAIDIYKEAIRILSTNLQIKSAYSKDIEIFNDRIKGANHNIYRIGVIGVTSSGKSTMINSFLGENILPSRIKPSSCQLVICHKGSKRSATIYHNNRPAEKIYGKNLTYDVLSKYADETYNSKNKENVKEIEITSPSFPFNDDIILIDSPGLDAFGFEGHEKLTMSTLLPTIDLCLLVTTCKSNSDEKTKDMLDAIASTHTATVPVIIVQNMMDSIQQSPDGTKSRNDVALDHRRRIERIIEKSGLPNKSAVKIVQYSAKNAVEGRINNEKGKIAESNYEKLTQTINDTINQLRPHIEGFRLKSAKKEIEEIAEQAKQHGGNTADSIVNQEFRHKDVKTKFENKTNKTKADISNILSQINNANNYIDSIETNNYNQTNLEKEFENHINIVKNIVKDCENKLIDVINYTTEFIANIGESVNIARRDLNFDIQVSSIQVPSVQKTKEKRREKKSGIINWVRRWWPFSDDDAGYEVYFVDVVDKKQTKKNLSQYVKNNTLVFKGCVDKLNQKIDAARIKIFTEVDKQFEAYNQKRKLLLERQQYTTIAKQLSELSENIIIKQQDIIGKGIAHTDRPEEKMYQYETPKDVYAIYSIAEKLRSSIHLNTIRCILGNNTGNYIVGWDRLSETACLNSYFGIKKSEDEIHDGINIINDEITICHNINCNTLNRLPNNVNLFLLTNGTQIGAAEKQILPFGNIASKFNSVYFVIQDFQEIINAQDKDVAETIRELNYFSKKYFSDSNKEILLLHENPIYNMVVATIQSNNIEQQTDEVGIWNDLSKFSYLRNENTDEIIKQIIKSFK